MSEVYQVKCLYGHDLEVERDNLGQRIVCPICQLIMIVSPPRKGQPIIPKYEITCKQGHVLRLKEKYVGREIRCPSCQSLTQVKVNKLLRFEDAERIHELPPSEEVKIAESQPEPSRLVVVSKRKPEVSEVVDLARVNIQPPTSTIVDLGAPESIRENKGASVEITFMASDDSSEHQLKPLFGSEK